MLQIVKVNDPLNRRNKETRSIPMRGQSVKELRDELIPRDVNIVTSLNGKILPNDSLDLYKVRDKDCITFVPVFGSSNNDWNMVLKLVVAVVAIVVMAYSGQWWGVGPLAAALIGMGISIVGNFLVDMLLPIEYKLPSIGGFNIGPPKPISYTPPSAPGGYGSSMGGVGEGYDTSQVFSWSPQTTQQEGGMIPRFYGYSKVHGNIISGNIESQPGAAGVAAQRVFTTYCGEGGGPREEETEYYRLNTVRSEALANYENKKAISDAAYKAYFDSYSYDPYSMSGGGFNEVLRNIWQLALVETNAALLALNAATSNYNAAGYILNVVGGYPARIEECETVSELVGGYPGTPDSNYLNVLIHLGLGPIYGISDIKINDQDYTKYDNIIVEDVLGSMDQPMIENFNDTKVEYSMSIQVEGGSSYTYTTQGDYFDALEVKIIFPRGLFSVDNDYGDMNYHSVGFQVDARKVGDTTWVSYASGSYTDCKSMAITKVVKFSVPSKGQYQIKISKTSAEQTSSKYGDVMYLSSISEIIYDDFQYPRQVLVGVKALATGQISGSFDFSCIVQGALIRVYDGISWAVIFSNNPAWVAYDILTQPVFDNDLNVIRYDGFDPVYIDTDAFYEWALYCDTPVPDGKGGTESRFTFNGGFDALTTMWDAVMKVCEMSRAMIVATGTKYSVFVDKPTNPSQLFSVANIYMDTFQEVFLPMEDRTSELEVEYLNSENDYQRETFNVYNDEIGNDSNKVLLQLIGITKQSEAYRIAKLRLLYNQHLTRAITFDVDVDAIACTVGDVVLVQHDVPQWGYGGRIISATTSTVTLDQEVTMTYDTYYSILIRLYDNTVVERQVLTEPGTTSVLTLTSPFTTLPQKYDPFAFGETDTEAKPFRVVGITKSQDFKCTISGIEYNHSLYSVDDETPVITTLEYSTLDPLPDVENIKLDELIIKSSDGTLVDCIDVYYSVPENSFFDHVEIWYRQSSPFYTTDIADVSNPIFAGTDKSGRFRIRGVQTGWNYIISIVTVNVLNKKTALTDAPWSEILTQGKLDPPSNVTGFAAIQDGQFVSFKWTHIEDGDLWGYEIRKGASWETSTILVTGISKDKWTWKAEMDGTFRFLIKAIDSSNLYSSTAASADLTLSGIDDSINIIVVQDEITKLGGPDGTFTHMSYSGEIPAVVVQYGYTDWASYLSNGVDFEQEGTIGIRLSNVFDASDPSATDLSYPDITDLTYPSDTDDHVTMIPETKMYYQYSSDDITYSASGEYFGIDQEVFRYLKAEFRVKLPTSTGLFELQHFYIAGDVPDVEFELNNFHVSGETGTDVILANYGYNLRVAPVVQATIKGATKAIVPIVSGESKTGFHIDLLDISDTKISGEVNLKITGY